MKKSIYASGPACGRALMSVRAAMLAAGFVGALGMSAASVRADLPGLFQFYEEDAGSEYTGGGQFQVRLPESSQLTSEQARFGKGSLLVGGSQAWQEMIQKPEWEDFRQEIREMTIATWVRPSGIESFVVFWRIPAALEWPGFFQFTVLGGTEKPLYFAATGPGGAEDERGIQYEAFSTQNVSLLPGAWNHLALTFKEGEVTFYFNGEPVGGPVTIPLDTIPQITQSLPSMKAVAGVAAGTFVDDFGLFGSRALTAEEIFLVYQDGLERFVKNHPELN